MKKKLTLSINQDLLIKAKNLAKEEGISLSAIFEKYLKKRIAEVKHHQGLEEPTKTYKSLSPAVRKKLGALNELDELLSKIQVSKDVDNADYRDERYAARS